MVRIGGPPVVEFTTTRKVPLVLPKLFETLQVTVVVPIGKSDPEPWSQPAPPASKVTNAPDDEVASATITSGSVGGSGGAFEERTMTVKVAGPMMRVPLPVSVAFTVTEYVPVVFATFHGIQTLSDVREATLRSS